MSHFRLLLMNFCKKNREKSYNVERTVLKVLHKVKVKLLSHVRLFATPWTVACTRILHPWDFLLLQGIFLTQGSNLGLPHCRQTLYLLNHQRSHKSLTQKVVVKNKQTHCWLSSGQSSIHPHLAQHSLLLQAKTKHSQWISLAEGR